MTWCLFFFLYFLFFIFLFFCTHTYVHVSSMFFSLSLSFFFFSYFLQLFCHWNLLNTKKSFFFFFLYNRKFLCIEITKRNDLVPFFFLPFFFLFFIFYIFFHFLHPSICPCYFFFFFFSYFLQLFSHWNLLNTKRSSFFFYNKKFLCIEITKRK